MLLNKSLFWDLIYPSHASQQILILELKLPLPCFSTNSYFLILFLSNVLFDWSSWIIIFLSNTVIGDYINTMKTTSIDFKFDFVSSFSTAWRNMNIEIKRSCQITKLLFDYLYTCNSKKAWKSKLQYKSRLSCIDITCHCTWNFFNTFLLLCIEIPKYWRIIWKCQNPSSKRPDIWTTFLDLYINLFSFNYLHI